jgi:hypothetical protein
MATPLDTALVDSYTRGMNVPVASQAGYAVRADEDGTNIEYIAGAQILVGSGTWDGKSASVHVQGSGSRTILMGPGYYIGQTVEILDAFGNAGSGTITMSGDGAAFLGSVTISSNGESRRYMWQEASGSAMRWRRVQG